MDVKKVHFNVFILEKNGELDKLGEINKIKTFPKRKSKLIPIILTKKSKLDSINEYNTKVLETIRKIKTLDFYSKIKCVVPSEYINKLKIISEDKISYLLYIYKWRRATGYLFLQKSPKDQKYIIYLDDQTMHSAECFGTTPEVAKNDIIEAFEDTINEIVKYHNDNINESNKIISEMKDFFNVKK